MLTRMKKNGRLLWGLASAWASLPMLWLAVPALPVAAQESGALRIFDHGSTRARIESCVSHDSIEFSIGHNSALLDDEDRLLVSAAMRQRYPMLRADGFAPSHVMLWRKPGADWLFVTLLTNPEKAGEMCFTATFAAAGFELTPRLLQKYFVSAAART
jgi:hypothetical protein